MKNTKTNNASTSLRLLLPLLLFSAASLSRPLFAQGTAFTYQGQLNAGAGLANGNYDFRFYVYDASTGGTILGGPVTNSMVTVSNGLFTTLIDFGAGVFTGGSNWLHIGVRTNGASSFTALSPRQQLTPTPYAIFAEGANAAGLTGTIPNGGLSGTYGGALTLNNPGNIIDGNGSGLTGLNASQLTTGVVPVGVLPPNVALLNANQTFTGVNSFSGNISLLDPTKTILFPATSGANSPMMAMFSSGTLNADRMVIAHSLAFPNWGLQYQDTSDKFNFLSAGTPVLTINLGAQSIYTIGNVGIGTVNPAQQYLSVHGGLNVDQADYNNGFLNNGNTNGYGITFGSVSGEGIASKRTAGGNQYGLDFYTGFAQRMSLNNSGNLMLDGNDTWLLNNNGNYGFGYRTSVAGLSPSGGDGIFVFGSRQQNLWVNSSGSGSFPNV